MDLVARPLAAFIALARRDPEAAVAQARADPHAGNRVHFLAWAAHFSDGSRAIAIAEEALAECAALDGYASVALAAWPLRALAERGADCARALPRLLERARALPNPVNRVDGLRRVLEAVLDDPRARAPIVSELVLAARAASSWKPPRVLADLAVMLAGPAPAESARLLAALAEGQQRRRALREIAAGGRAPPVFFS